jgi:hypothetical protein
MMSVVVVERDRLVFTVIECAGFTEESGTEYIVRIEQIRDRIGILAIQAFMNGSSTNANLLWPD